MKIKPSKSKGLSSIKGKLTDQFFFFGNEIISTVMERPVKSLSWWYNTSLKDTEQGEQLKKDGIIGLQSMDKTFLPGRLKLWCMQCGLLPCLMWPLALYISKIEKLEKLIGSFVRKWLGLPRCLSSVDLYSK